MSYILDALRRADAERDRGAVPGLHTQSALAGGGTAFAAPTSPRPAWLWLGAGALGVIAIGAAAWALYGASRSSDAPVVAAAGPKMAPAGGTGGASPAATGLPTAPAPGPANPDAAARTRAEEAAPAAAPAAPTARATNPAEADRAGVPVPTRRAPPPAAARPPVAAADRPSVAAATARPPPAATPVDSRAIPVGGDTPPALTPTAPAAVAERIYTVQELPEDVQRELPKLTVGGSMYAPTPASRLLIVNGQVLHEGDSLPPGLVLRQIRLKSAVFSYRDRRFEIRY